MRFSRLLGCMAALVVVASAHALTESERDAYFLLLMGSKDNEVKACASGALRHNAALVGMRVTMSDDEVAARLTGGITDSRLLAAREEQAAAWRKTRKPAELAHMEYERCLEDAGVGARLGPLGVTCFSFAALPAAAEIYKSAGRSRDEATAYLLRDFGAQLPAEVVRQVADDVYSMDAGSTSYEAHRKVVANCIRHAR
jgi:hypothetical protein